MMLSIIHITRRLNGRALQAFLGGQSAMIDRTGISHSLISQWFGESRSREPKPIGNAAARDLETALASQIKAITGKYYDGWLDDPHPDAWANYLTDNEIEDYENAENCYPESVILNACALMEDILQKKKIVKISPVKRAKLLLAILHFWQQSENLSQSDIQRLIDLSDIG